MGEDDDFGSITGEWKRDTTTPVDADTPVEQRFLLQLRDTPTDLEMRMVFADWLEERGYPNKAEVVRLNAEPPTEGTEAMRQLRQASKFVEPDWLAMVSRAPIENCLAISCPRTWDNLTSTDRPRVRHCGVCNVSIHFCGSFTDVREHGFAADCVVFSSALDRGDAAREYESAHDDRDLTGDIIPVPDLDPADAAQFAYQLVVPPPIEDTDEGGTVYAEDLGVTPDD